MIRILNILVCGQSSFIKKKKKISVRIVNCRSEKSDIVNIVSFSLTIHGISFSNTSLNLPCARHWNMQVIRIQFQERYRHRSVILLPIRFVPRLSRIRAKDIAIPFIRYSGNNLCVYIGNDGSNKMRTPRCNLETTSKWVRKWMPYITHICRRSYIYYRYMCVRCGLISPSPFVNLWPNGMNYFLNAALPSSLTANIFCGIKQEFWLIRRQNQTELF